MSNDDIPQLFGFCICIKCLFCFFLLVISSNIFPNSLINKILKIIHNLENGLLHKASFVKHKTNPNFFFHKT